MQNGATCAVNNFSPCDYAKQPKADWLAAITSYSNLLFTQVQQIKANTWMWCTPSIWLYWLEGHSSTLAQIQSTVCCHTHNTQGSCWRLYSDVLLVFTKCLWRPICWAVLYVNLIKKRGVHSIESEHVQFQGMHAAANHQGMKWGSKINRTKLLQGARCNALVGCPHSSQTCANCVLAQSWGSKWIFVNVYITKRTLVK